MLKLRRGLLMRSTTRTLQVTWKHMVKLALLWFSVAAVFAQKTVVVRPVEVDDVLVNPEMGIQTFQRSNGDPINPGSRWSEAGPSTAPAPAQSRPDFPES